MKQVCCFSKAWWQAASDGTCLTYMNDIKVPMARPSRSKFARACGRCAGYGWETLLLYGAQQSFKEGGSVVTGRTEASVARIGAVSVRRDKRVTAAHARCPKLYDRRIEKGV